MRHTIADSSCPFHGLTLTVRRMEERKPNRGPNDVTPKWNEVAVTIPRKKEGHRDLIRMRVADCSPLNLDAQLSMWRIALHRELLIVKKREPLETDYLVEIPSDSADDNRHCREFAEAISICKHFKRDA